LFRNMSAGFDSIYQDGFFGSVGKFGTGKVRLRRWVLVVGDALRTGSFFPPKGFARYGLPKGQCGRVVESLHRLLSIARGSSELKETSSRLKES